MKRLLKCVLPAIALLALSAPATGSAQPIRWRGYQGWGPRDGYGRLYDPAKAETIHGTVARVERITPIRGMSHGVQVVVETADGALPVHLGPAWFVENQDVKLAAGDEIEVHGARAAIAGKPFLVAATVTKKDAVLQLRDDSGVPVWAGWRRRAN